MNGTYLVFIIQAYDLYDKEREVLKELVTLQLIATDEKSAMEKAKKLVKKKGYRLAQIVEKEHGT